MSAYCDVIVTVYKGSAEVKECISSVLERSGDALAKLIIVNDNSPEPAIGEYLDALAREGDSRITILTNDENLGYLKSCNRGMEQSQNDVVLLNSDTVVTVGWLRKMLDCAYSDARIAVVSPLTNNSVLCSVPVIATENSLPAGLNIEQYAEIIEKSSFRRYPWLPSCFGFCMLIKRSVISEIGMLDEVYDKGYHEEVDFCARARAAGYMNVLCDDTYIHHYGSVSFADDKYDLSDRNEQIILKRYPDITEEIRAFISGEILSDIHLNLEIHTMLWASEQKTVFFMLHKNPFDDIGHVRGGVEYHMWDIARNMRGCNYAVWYPDGDAPLVSKYMLAINVDGIRTTLEFKLKNPVAQGMAHHAEVEGILRQALMMLNVSAVHIQHFLRNTYDILDVCAALGVPYYVTLHDFYAICPNYTLTTPDGEYCGVIEDKQSCAYGNCFGGLVGDHRIRAHREAMQVALEGARQVFVPSQFLQQSVETLFEGIRCAVREPYYPIPDEAPVEVEKDGVLRVAFLGALSGHKGSADFKRLLDMRLEGVEWHVFGAVAEEDKKEIAAYERSGSLVLHGRYARDTIVNELKRAGIDIVLLFSRLPETYGYTLTEAWLAGCPVVSTNMGAIPLRVAERGAGWIVSGGVAEETAAILQSAQQDAALLDAKKAKIEKIGHAGMQARVDFYTDIYIREESAATHSGYDPESMLVIWKRAAMAGVLLTRPQKEVMDGLVTSRLYMDTGAGFSEKECLHKYVPLGPCFKVRFDFIDKKVCKVLRFDIAELYHCAMRINMAEVHYADGSVQKLGAFGTNGTDDGDGFYVFSTPDPVVMWEVKKKPISYFVISGEWYIEARSKYTEEIAEPKVFTLEVEERTSRAYVDKGDGITEEGMVSTALALPEVGLTASVELKKPAPIIRWDPIEFAGCELQVKKVLVKTTLDEWRLAEPSAVMHNGREKNGWVRFYDSDPWIIVSEGALIKGAKFKVKLRINEKVKGNIRYVARKLKRKVFGKK